jgi:hypothetical protein
MRIALVSVSRAPEIDAPLLMRVASAIEVQLTNDYARFWQSAGPVVHVYDTLSQIPVDDRTAPLVIFDDTDSNDFLGWHAVRGTGRAFGRIFWSPIKKHGGTLLEGANSLSCVVSHEALEMTGNPYVNLWVDMPDGVTEEAAELCDRVQADAYAIDGVAVSNFLGPRSFRDGDGPYDFLGNTKAPWDLTPGGYAIRRKAGEEFHVFGDAVPEWQREERRAASRVARGRAERGVGSR